MSRPGACPSAVALATLVLVSACRAPAPPAATDDWQTFSGTWTASGERQTLRTEDHGTAVILRLSGAVVLATDGGLGRGFRGEIIGFNDGRDLSVGRWVWTDDTGAQIFGEVTGEPVQTGRRFVGTITGGSGRYAGISGDFAFSWQSVVVTAEGTIQGRTVGLAGRYRRQAVTR
jgi:hypothetical protein